MKEVNMDYGDNKAKTTPIGMYTLHTEPRAPSI